MGHKLIYPLVGVALFGAGLVDWSIRARWENSTVIANVVDGLEALPTRLGDWVGQPVSLDEIIVQVAACAGYKSYRYVNERTGNSVDVTVMVGIPGQMAEHSPETCYPGAGYTLDRRSWHREPVSRFLGEETEGELARMDFLRGDHPRPIRVWHGWFDGERWSRPEYPRLSFVASPVLCRLQVSAALVPDLLADDSNQLIDPGERFLKAFLPKATQALTRNP
jgi:hypothetical protein